MSWAGKMIILLEAFDHRGNHKIQLQKLVIHRNNNPRATVEITFTPVKKKPKQMLLSIDLKAQENKINRILKTAFLITWTGVLASSVYLFCMFIFVKT